MRPTLNQLLCAVLLIGGLSLAGCKQSEGERCEVNGDCAGGLTCSGASTGNGNCTSSPTGITPLPDAAPTGDAGAAADVSAADHAASTDGAGDGPTDATLDTQPEVAAPAPDAPAGG